MIDPGLGYLVGVNVSGPIPVTIENIRDRCRWQFGIDRIGSGMTFAFDSIIKTLKNFFPRGTEVQLCEGRRHE